MYRKMAWLAVVAGTIIGGITIYRDNQRAEITEYLFALKIIEEQRQQAATKQQARTLMALGLAIILTQILCTAVVLRGLDQTRKAAAAQASAMAALEMEKAVTAKAVLIRSPESGGIAAIFPVEQIQR